MNYIKKLISLPTTEKILLLEAIGLLFWSKFVLLILPFRKVINVNYGKRKEKITNPDPELLMQVKKTLYRANRVALWRNKCLVQSIAGRWILQLRGIESQILIGVKYDDSKNLDAHSWLKVNDFEIINSGNGYYELHVINQIKY